MGGRLLAECTLLRYASGTLLDAADGGASTVLPAGTAVQVLDTSQEGWWKVAAVHESASGGTEESGVLVAQGDTVILHCR